MTSSVKEQNTRGRKDEMTRKETKEINKARRRTHRQRTVPISNRISIIIINVYIPNQMILYVIDVDRLI